MILKIGPVTGSGSQLTEKDVSEWVAEGMRINSEPVYESEFTAVDGTEYRVLKSRKVKVSVSLEMVGATDAAAILALCEQEKVQLVIGCPYSMTIDCYAPQVSMEMVTEGDTTGTTGDLWDISLNFESVALDRL